MTKQHLVNPFFFETTSDRWSFTDREALVPEVQKYMSEPGRRLLIHGRRRMGKTSLILNAAASAKKTLLFCDLSTVANIGEVARVLLAAAPAQSNLDRVMKLAGKYFKSVNLKAGKVSLSGDFRTEEGDDTLGSVLNFLNEQAALSDEVWTICFDEFQELRALGEKMDWKLRGITQHHRNLSYIFTGSDHRIVAWMTEPSAPFFKQVDQFEVGPIAPSHMARWIEERAKFGGIGHFTWGEQIVETGGPCTGDIVRLARTTFDLLVQKPKEATPVTRAMENISLFQMRPEFVAQWHSLTIPQRNVLRAIAAGKAPQAADTLREFGIKAASTAATAINALTDRQYITRSEGALVFDSPFFRFWTAAHSTT